MPPLPDFAPSLSTLAYRPWAIDQPWLQRAFELSLHAERESDEAQVAAVTANTRRGVVAVIPIRGTIAPGYRGMTSPAALVTAVRIAVADPGISGIVLHVDSPGGSVAGLPEAADAIRHARGAKPIVAQVDTLAASAAYWLAAQADEIVVTPSSEVGSIGVFTAHFDFSKMLDTVGLKVTWIFAGRYKVEGNPAEPLQEDARVHLQSHVDHYYGMFVSAVAKGRGVGVEQVRKAWGEGRTVTAQDAVDRGMADSVGTLEETIRRVGRGKTSAPVPAAAAQDSWRARRQRMRELVAG